MNKSKILLCGCEGFDENGEPIVDEKVEGEVPATDPVPPADEPKQGEGEGGEVPATDPVPPADEPTITEENVRVVADQPVVDETPIPEEEKTVNTEIEKETVSLEDLEETVDNHLQQQENLERVSDQLEDTIDDTRPALAEGGISNEAVNMVHSLLARIKREHSVVIGKESFSTKFATESFGLSKSVRLSNSKALVNALAAEATGIAQSLKAMAISVVKVVIDLLNKLVNVVDAQGRRAKSLKERISKLDATYKEGVEFESTRIANALVKNKNGDQWKPVEFSGKLAQYSMDTTAVSGAIAKVTNGTQPLVSKIQAAVKSEDKDGLLASAKDAVAQFFAQNWKAVTGPRMAKGETFVGVTLEGGDLKGVTKESLEAKDAKFTTPAKTELSTIVDNAIKASEAIKKARSEYGNIYSAKAKLGDEADRIVASVPKDAPESLKSATRQAVTELVRDGREELNALKFLTSACASGVGVSLDYVDLCINKGSKKAKKDDKASA